LVRTFEDLIVERIKATELEPAFQEQAIAFMGRLEQGHVTL
jgi:hypothetical protein